MNRRISFPAADLPPPRSPAGFCESSPFASPPAEEDFSFFFFSFLFFSFSSRGSLTRRDGGTYAPAGSDETRSAFGARSFFARVKG